jgi:hypothetical protein
LNERSRDLSGRRPCLPPREEALRFPANLLLDKSREVSNPKSKDWLPFRVIWRKKFYHLPNLTILKLTLQLGGCLRKSAPFIFPFLSQVLKYNLRFEFPICELSID